MQIHVEENWTRRVSPSCQSISAVMSVCWGLLDSLQTAHIKEDRGLSNGGVRQRLERNSGKGLADVLGPSWHGRGVGGWSSLIQNVFIFSGSPLLCSSAFGPDHILCWGRYRRGRGDGGLPLHVTLFWELCHPTLAAVGDGSMSELDKAALCILRGNSQSAECGGIKFSVQDLHQNVLANIKRKNVIHIRG
jgi:hypothetical protein